MGLSVNKQHKRMRKRQLECKKDNSDCSYAKEGYCCGCKGHKTNEKRLKRLINGKISI